MCVRVLQIRQEKPYYIADPEVDSLVSISLFSRHERARIRAKRDVSSVSSPDTHRLSPRIISSSTLAREIGRLSTIESLDFSSGWRARENRETSCARSSEASTLNYGAN